jgi:hypothetical protein
VVSQFRLQLQTEILHVPTAEIQINRRQRSFKVWADFVVLERDPLKDIRNASSIASVWIAGNKVKRVEPQTGDVK